MIVQGNVGNLKANPCQISSLRLHLRNYGYERRQFVVVNKAGSASVVAAPLANVRFRLDNLGPQPGSRKKAKRKGRGISAGQGGSCGFGMRGQKSRSGPGVRRGFEGGQMPLYRRIPKLRGIAGGKMSCCHTFLCFVILLSYKDFYDIVIEGNSSVRHTHFSKFSKIV